jgi:hypothetical protein
MAGFLGGSSGSGGGGEIQFPAEFIDPVTKLRVSEPETLIDTDFEYGLQPTKWETVELINNTPSFFSKSGDTTINGILAMVTTATSREVKVTTQDNHGLAVGIPINVSGTKSITADGSYIINSIPDPKTFTYLAKQNQDFTASIFDLYTSIITGEFFQGSQIKISDSQGIVTNAGSPSVLTVQTDSPHGFQVGTPFYFLNLNSTVSQQFDASNTGAKTFDSSNSATAQTFDGSNTLTSYTINLNNKALTTGTTSLTQTHSTANKTITVLHSSETFTGKVVGTPLYYNVTAQSGYFQTYPRGVVYLADNSFNVLGASTSTFSVSSIPGGTPIDIPSYPNGSFQLASDAALFAGNNLDLANQVTITPTIATATVFDGTNSAGSLSTVNTYSTQIIQLNNDAGTTVSPALFVGAMVLYTSSDGAPGQASGLAHNTTYFVTYYNEPAGASVPGFFQIKVAATPGGADITVAGGTGTQKFRKIGVSIDKNILHVPFHNLVVGDMVKYVYPAGTPVAMTNRTSDFIYVSAVYDTYNIQLDLLPGLTATGGTITTAAGYKIHTFTGAGTQTFAVTGTGTIEYMVIAGGGGGGTDMGGGGGAGGYLAGSTTFTSGNYTITTGAGGRGARGLYNVNEATLDYVSGGNSSIVGSGVNIVSIGGGKGGSNHRWDSLPTVPALTGGSGGGMAGNTNASGAGRIAGTPGQGFAGGVSAGTGYSGSQWYSGGGGGAGGQGLDGNLNGNTRPSGGPGVQNAILGTSYFWAGGGGGGIWSGTDQGVGRAGNGGSGGGGGGAGGNEHGAGGTGGLAVGAPGTGPNGASGANNNANGGSAGQNTGSGGGGNSHNTTNDIRAGSGANGIVVVRYLNA